MSSASKMTRIVAKVPAAYRTATPRYWCNHCADSHDSKAIIVVHYQEWHPEHISEVASWDGRVKQTYDQTRHFGNESDWEGEEQGARDLHDEGSDEEDMRDEAAKGMRVGPIPCNVCFPLPFPVSSRSRLFSCNYLLILLQNRPTRNQTENTEKRRGSESR